MKILEDKFKEKIKKGKQKSVQDLKIELTHDFPTKMWLSGGNDKNLLLWLKLKFDTPYPNIK